MVENKENRKEKKIWGQDKHKNIYLTLKGSWKHIWLYMRLYETNPKDINYRIKKYIGN